MMGFDSPGESRPFFYVRGYAVNLATLLVGIYVVALVACSFLMAAGQMGFLSALAFDSASVARRGEVWRLVTYPLIQPPSLWFLLDMYLLWAFGREVEQFFGRQTFLKLYAALLIAPVVLLTALDYAGVPSRVIGTNALHFGVFALFVFVYPGVRFGLLPITALTLLLILLAIYTLMDLAGQNLSGLFLLWTSVGLAYFGVRAAGAAGGLPFLERLQRSLARRRAPTPSRGGGSSAVKPRARPRRAVEAGVGGAPAPAGSANAAAPSGRDVHESIDPLLDKIAKHGLASLSASEKATLERARASLLRKDRRP